MGTKGKLTFVLLALCLAVLPPRALAAGGGDAAALPEADRNGVITLTRDVTADGTLTIRGADALDLAGHTLTVDLLQVDADLTIRDSSRRESGRIVSTESVTCAVGPGGALTVESGSIENTAPGGTAILNTGTLAVTGGSVAGDRAVRICAGELTVTGGTVTGTALFDGADGGVQGAVVAGKDGKGCPGDVSVSISDGAVIENTARGEGLRPAVVVSDQYMADTARQTVQGPGGAGSNQSFTYAGTSIAVLVDGASVTGDVVKTSGLTRTAASRDGGDVTLTVQNTVVNGSVVNQSATGLTVRDATVTGGVTNTGGGSVVVLGNSKVQGETANSGGGLLYVEGAEGQTAAALNGRAGKAYSSLTDAIDDARPGDTVTLTADAALSRTLTLSKDVTLQGDEAGRKLTGAEGKKAGIVVNGAAVTLKGLTITGLSGDRGAVSIPADAADGTRLTALDLNISDFPRAAFELLGGEAEIRGCLIDCGGQETVTRRGFAIENASVTIRDTVIQGADAPDQSGAAAGLEIGGGSAVTIDGCSILSAADGIVLSRDARDSAVTVRDTVVEARKAALEVQDHAGKTGAAALLVESGSFAGTVGYRYDETDGPASEKLDAGACLLQISGGSFSVSVGEYAAPGLTAELYHSGGTPYSYYAALSEALAAADSGDTVRVLNAGEDSGVSVFHVTLDRGGAEGKVTILVPDGESIPLPTLTRAGYAFTGWAGETASYRGGAAYLADGDATLTAQWGQISSVIPFVAGSGSVTIHPAGAAENAIEGTVITLTVHPADGYALDALTAVDAGGAELKLSDLGGGKYAFAMPDSGVIVSASFTAAERDPAALTYADVSEGDWYYEAVRYVTANGLMNGLDGGAFGPDETASRAMIVTILYRLEGEPAVGAAAFTDVPEGAWYAGATAWAAANGIVTGYGDGSFDPDAAITREQLAAILYRYAGYKGCDSAAAGAGLDGYDDQGQVSGYAADALSWASARGLITGVTGSSMAPGGSADRAQVATILMRFCENFLK